MMQRILYCSEEILSELLGIYSDTSRTFHHRVSQHDLDQDATNAVEYASLAA